MHVLDTLCPNRLSVVRNERPDSFENLAGRLIETTFPELPVPASVHRDQLCEDADPAGPGRISIDAIHQWENENGT